MCCRRGRQAAPISFVVVQKEYKRMKSGMMGKVSFGLAVSPWLFAVPEALSLPGFG